MIATVRNRLIARETVVLVVLWSTSAGDPADGGRQALWWLLLEAPREEDSDGIRRSREAPLGRERGRARAVASNRESKWTC